MVYHRGLNIFPCAIHQALLFIHSMCNNLHLLTQTVSASLLHPIPLGNHESIFSMFVSLFFLVVHLCHVLDSTYKLYNMVFAFFFLTSLINISWTIKKAEHRRIDALELLCSRRLLRLPWTARRSNQSILKEISPGCSLERLMLKLKLQYFGHLMQRSDSFEKTLMLGKIEGRRRRG